MAFSVTLVMVDNVNVGRSNGTSIFDIIMLHGFKIVVIKSRSAPFVFNDVGLRMRWVRLQWHSGIVQLIFLIHVETLVNLSSRSRMRKLAFGLGSSFLQLEIREHGDHHEDDENEEDDDDGDADVDGSLGLGNTEDFHITAIQINARRNIGL